MLRVETLESRSLMASLTGGDFVVIDAGIPNQTLDLAVLLGDLNASPGILSYGSLGEGPAGNADVEWYTFTLSQAARVVSELEAQPDDTAFRGVLSLYNSNPYDFGDPYYLNGYRLLEQDSATGEDDAAILDRVLGPGAYFLAVSGAGNRHFHPLIGGSGLPGTPGDFALRVGATDAGLGAFAGPAVLGSNPAPGADLDRSPLIVRLELSSPIDPFTVFPGDTVTLTYNPGGTFGDGNDQVLMLANTNVSPTGTELQLILQAPLAPGYYQVVLAGDAGTGRFVITAPDGTPLGTDDDHPSGRDFISTFRVVGHEGITAPGVTADDTPTTSHDLGDVTTLGIIQVGGAIGDDPFYNPNNSSDPYFPEPIYSPGNDVDMYHFRITGPGRYAFLAEVFAGRIGSPLDPGVSLYRLDPDDGTLRFVDGNNNTYNPLETADGSATPLYSDSALNVSLEAGDYYLVVAAGSNTPSPLELAPPGSFGLFDPSISHSGEMGWSTGLYVLNLLVHAAPEPPRVLATNPVAGSTLDRPPTELVVTFDVPVNLPRLAFQTFQLSSQTTLAVVFVLAGDGTRYFPRFLSYDNASNQARFLMLDGLPDGDYELHFSGAEGLGDLAGNPLEANDASGDFVVKFSVDGPDRGTNGDPLVWTDQEPVDGPDTPQDLGVLFPHELESGVTVMRNFRGASGQVPSDSADVYRFQVLQTRIYTFVLSGDDIPRGVGLVLTDTLGQSMGLVSHRGGKTLYGTLTAGTYLLEVGEWDEEHAADLVYQVLLTFTSSFENAPPLLAGPEPLVAVRLDSIAPPPQPPPPPPVTPPVTPPATPPVAPPVTPPVTPPATPPVTPTDPTTPTPTPSTPTGSETPSGSPYGPIGIPTGGIVTPPADAGGPIPIDPYLPTPQAGAGIALPVPAADDGTFLGVSPALGLVALANGSIGGERGSDGSGMDPNEPTRYAAAIARSVVTTGVIVATISPSWLEARDKAEGEVVAEAPSLVQLAEPGIEPPKVASSSTRLDDLVAWLAGFVPEFLGLRADERPTASIVESPPAVVPSAEQAEAGAAGEHTADLAEVQPSADGDGAVLADGEHAWLYVLSATSVAAIVYARRRAAGRQEERRKRPVRTSPRPIPGSSLKSVLKGIPRPSFARIRIGSEQDTATVRTNAAMRK